MAPPSNALIYCRISKDRTGAGLGVDRQERDCRDLADRLGWTITGVEVDNDISASSGKLRPAYERTLDALASGRADGVIAWHADRLHRRPAELERFIDVCETNGVAVQTVRAGELDLTTPSGRMVARMLGSAARYEVEQMSARMRAKKKQQALNGERMGGRRPFGYEADGLTVRPGEAELMRDAITTLIGGGSLKAIVRQWNDAGVLGTRGAPWTTRNLRIAILRGGRYAGVVERDGEVIATAQWPAIVTLDQLTAVRAVLNDPARKLVTSTARKWLCSGVAVDGPTGRTVVVTKGKIERIYIAAGQRAGSAAVPAAALDEYVEALVIERLSRPDAVAVITPDREGIDTAKIRGERDTLAARRTGAATLFADGKIGVDQLATITAALDGQIDGLDAILQRENAEAHRNSHLAALVGSADVAAEWARLPMETRSRLVAELMHITVWPMPVRAVDGRRPRRVFDAEQVAVEWRSDRA